MTISALDIVSNSPNIEMVQLPTQRFYPCNGILILHYLKIILAPPQTGTSPIQIVLIKDNPKNLGPQEYEKKRPVLADQGELG